MTRASAETTHRLRCSERVQQFGCLSLILFVARCARFARDPLQKRLERIRSRRRRRWLNRRGAPIVLPVALIVFLDHVREHESVAVTRDGANESRLARVVLQHAPDRANRLAQRAVGDDHVAPDPLEDLAAMDGLAATLDEEDQQIEIAWNQRQLAPVSDEDSAAGREDEFTETIPWHRTRCSYSRSKVKG